MIFGKDDIETELQFNNVIYASNMSTNLFSLMATYDKDYETRITLGYDLRIFHGEILIAVAIRDEGELFRLKTIIDSYALITAQISEKRHPKSTSISDTNEWIISTRKMSEDWQR